ncbi:CmcI family methyltransferase [Rhodanobacter ginsengiterrae]|uniref:CmcI family methyltransferase n=1 Tax=Rhodanobacter ginsengiterrae TaxID=2008451 RepID=UPI003CEA4DF6
MMTNGQTPAPPVREVEGVVDGFSGYVARGWARCMDDQAEPLTIEIRAGDTLLGSGLANLYRADLAAAGKKDGHCAFAIALDWLPDDGTELAVIAIGHGRIHPLAGSPLVVSQVSVAAPPAAVDILPLPLGTAQWQGSLDQCGPRLIRGWVRRRDGNGSSPMLALHEGGRELLRFTANQWRADVAELQHGDGCCGFEVALPDTLCDDHLHRLDLRLADTGETLLQAPFVVRIARASLSSRERSRWPAALAREPVAEPVTLSVIVNFYNMRREAERTLTSLRSDYQLGAGDFSYEVLCVDNGSSPPLEEDWITSFGPQFRLIRPRQQASSPCAALNEAARLARGKYLAVMIDGAHLLTPGVFEEARLAWRQDPDAVVALRHWFVGGDQRWLAMSGYTREQEDVLFDRIRWPANGYELFRIGAPIGESPEPWFDGLSESNCLMLPTALYDRLGGFDEAFDQAGGGFANLDLWRRASEASEGALVCLIGEASFHQFHGGTTTNVDDIEKDLRVRGYANAYRALRGEDYLWVERSQLSFRGRLRSEFATGVRQRSLLPLRLGITDQIRPGQLALHFDEGAQTHLQSVYAECGLHNDVRWLGQPVGVAPADLISLQEIIQQVRPDAIVAVGVTTGLVGFIDDVLLAADLPASRVLHVDAQACTAASGRVTSLRGLPLDPAIQAAVRHWLGSAETVLVLHAAGSAEAFSVASLQAYARLVSHRSYLICTGTLFGQPWLGYSSHQHVQTIREFTRGDSTFVSDRGWTRQLISTCPGGYLRKVGGSLTAAQYDATLDTFTADATASAPPLPGNPQ